MTYYNPVKKYYAERGLNTYGIEPTRQLASEYLGNPKLIKAIKDFHKSYPGKECYTKSCQVSISIVYSVYTALTTHSNGAIVKISQAELARRHGFSLSGVERAITFLRRAKIISVTHNYEGEGKDRKRGVSTIKLIMFYAYVRHLRDLKRADDNDKNQENHNKIKENSANYSNDDKILASNTNESGVVHEN